MYCNEDPVATEKHTNICAYSWFIGPNIMCTVGKLEILYIFSDRYGKLLLYIVLLSKIKMLGLKLIEYLILKLLINYPFACAYQVDGWICCNKYLNNFLNSIKFSILFWRSCTIINSMHNAIFQEITIDNKYLKKNMLIPTFVFAFVGHRLTFGTA
jgi:hypothetical protein